MLLRRLSLLAVAVVAVGCKNENKVVATIPTTTVSRADIAIRVQATGTVEPIDPVEVKSKAQGMVTEMPVEVGTTVKPGQVLARIDPRDVQNQYDQAVADDVVSNASLQKAVRDRARQDTMFAMHVITRAGYDSSRSTYAAALSDMVSKRANLDIARQKLQDATVESPISGTVISRPTTQGQIITSATSANGGTTLMTIANLSRVRMRVTIDEVEMANVRLGQPVTVAVDAYRDQNFRGTIEKVEPQALVSQGVTFFPVLVSIDNRQGLLMPGMNGEVTINAGDLHNVLQVPIDAVRPTNELAPVARMFGVPADSLINAMRPELTSGQGTTGIPGRYVVVQLADGSFEMRMIKTGPTDLRVVQVLDGLKEGDKVVQLGAVMTTAPTLRPKLQMAANLKRGATREASAKPQGAARPPAPTQAGKAISKP